MGFYVNASIKAKCPLYESVVRSGQGRIAGVQCEPVSQDFGFKVSNVLRCVNIQETLALKAKFCDGNYDRCPYFRFWMMAHEKDWS